MGLFRNIILLLGTLGVLTGNLRSAVPYTFKSVQVRGGGFVSGIIYHPLQSGMVYARTDMGGAYRSDDGGLNWIPLTDFLNRDQADSMGNLAIAIDPSDMNRVYLECGKYTASWAGNGTFLASVNKGNTWTLSNLPFKVGGNEDGRGTGERLSVDPNLGSNLWMGSNAAGLWRSTNYGTSWTAVPSFTPTSVTFVLIDKASGSTGVASQTIYVGVNTQGSSLWRSTDNGATWAIVAGSPAGQVARRAALNGTNLYLAFCDTLGPNSAVASGATFKLNTSTLVWTAINIPVGQGGTGGITVDPANPNNIAASTMMRWWPADEIYRSNNGGASWTATLATATWDRSSAPWVTSLYPHWIADVEMDPNNINKALWVTGYGVFGTSNFQANPVTWAFMSTGIEQSVPVQLISPSVGAPVLSAMGDIDGFKHDTLDLPSNRFAPPVGTTLAIAFAEAVPAKMVKADNAGAPSNYGGYSTDGGANWTAFSAFPAGATGGGVQSIAINATGTNIVWAPAGASCSYSTNNGANWAACAGGIPANLGMVADRINGNKFYAVDAALGRVWVSTNGGVSFTVGATGLPTLPGYQLNDASLKATLGIEGDLWLNLGSGGLHHSTNSGSTFTKLPQWTNAYQVSTGKSASAGYPALYVFGTIAGIRGFYRSDDTGVTWTRINDDLHQYGWIHDFTGDPRIYGRLYFSAEGRGLFYGDSPAVGTPTFTATPTFSFSASPTATLTTSKSASLTSTVTGTLTATGTSTFSATLSPTPSSSATVSPSTTMTPSATATQTRTASPTVSSSRTPSFSMTVTQTYSTTATLSATPSISSTYTDVPVGSTFTNTPTASPSPTETATPTDTPSASPSVTFSSSATPSTSVTPSETATLTDLATATASATKTATPSVSPVDTVSFTKTLTVTPLNTSTPTQSPLFTATPSLTAIAIAIVTTTGTITTTIGIGASATAAMDPQPLAILLSSAVPNPGPVAIAFQLSAAADDVDLRVWTSSMTLVTTVHSGPRLAGWNYVALPTNFVVASSNATYFYTLSAHRGGQTSLPSHSGKFQILR